MCAHYAFRDKNGFSIQSTSMLLKRPCGLGYDTATSWCFEGMRFIRLDEGGFQKRDTDCKPFRILDSKPRSLGLIHYFEPPSIFKDQGFLLDDEMIKCPIPNNLPNFQEYVIHHGRTFIEENSANVARNHWRPGADVVDNTENNPKQLAGFEVAYYRLVNVDVQTSLLKILNGLRMNNALATGTTTFERLDDFTDPTLSFEKFQKHGFCLQVESTGKLAMTFERVEKLLLFMIEDLFAKDHNEEYIDKKVAEQRASIAFCRLKCRKGAPETTCPITIVKHLTASLRDLLWNLTKTLMHNDDMILSDIGSRNIYTGRVISKKKLTLYMYPDLVLNSARNSVITEPSEATSVTSNAPLLVSPFVPPPSYEESLNNG